MGALLVRVGAARDHENGARGRPADRSTPTIGSGVITTPTATESRLPIASPIAAPAYVPAAWSSPGAGSTAWECSRKRARVIAPIGSGMIE